MQFPWGQKKAAFKTKGGEWIDAEASPPSPRSSPAPCGLALSLPGHRTLAVLLGRQLFLGSLLVGKQYDLVPTLTDE